MRDEAIQQAREEDEASVEKEAIIALGGEAWLQVYLTEKEKERINAAFFTALEESNGDIGDFWSYLYESPHDDNWTHVWNNQKAWHFW